MSATLRLRVHDDNEDNETEIWLDTEVADCDGICLGCGTREEALAQAKLELEHALRQVDRHIARVQHKGQSRSDWEGEGVS